MNTNILYANQNMNKNIKYACKYFDYLCVYALLYGMVCFCGM